ncbi:hypothetical protein DBR06_SOUSAS1110057, partial [Sousa chinensis]
LLPGRKVVVICCEGIHTSGNFCRRKLQYLVFFHKCINTNLS